MSARSLILGLDGGDLDLVASLGPERLPHLHALMARGSYAALRSVQPPATLPNWTTFLTAADPGVHGVFDFTLRQGYRVRFAGGTIREAPTLVRRLDQLGMQCALVGFPATWPPERLERGVFISGWDAPVAFEADRSFIWPPDLYDAVRARFGTPRFDDVDEFDAERPGWHRALPEALIGRIARKRDLALWLLGGRPWDVFAFYFGESDTAAHHLWALHDPASPRHPRGTSAGDRAGLMRVYQALDEAVGALVAEAGPDAEITVVSDHGFGGASDKVLYLNRFLAEQGLLRFRASSLHDQALGTLKDAALTGLPPALRERAFRALGARLPSWLESRVRFGAIEMRHTLAFSDELNYFPAVHLNVRGREPQGRIHPHDVARVTRDVEQALLALRDPWTGAPVVAHVWRREALFSGPHVARAPDLLLDLHLDGAGYSYNLMPTAGAPPGTGAWRKLEPGEYLGRKGRSLAGSHRSHGLYVAAGPRVRPAGRIDAHIADAAQTWLARLDVRIPEASAGRVLHEILRAPGDDARTLPEVPPPSPKLDAADESRIERRLRALGYIE